MSKMVDDHRRRFLQNSASTAMLGLLSTSLINTSFFNESFIAKAKASTGLAEINFTFAAPKFSLPDMNGKIHKSSDYYGKVVLISFWASWCPPCRKEMPSLARLSEKLPKDKIEVLAVNVGDSEEKIESFLKRIDNPALKILTNKNSSVMGEWFLRGLPVSYVLDQKGNIKLGAIGGLEWDTPEIEKKLLALVK